MEDDGGGGCGGVTSDESSTAEESPLRGKRPRTPPVAAAADTERPCTQHLRRQAQLFGCRHTADVADMTQPRFKAFGGVPWVVYRFSSAAFLTVVIGCDWAFYGQYRTFPATWPVYLTNLTLFIQTVTLWFKFVVTLCDTWTLRSGTSSHGALRYRRYHDLLWTADTLVASSALTVSAVYWVIVFDPVRHGYTFINIGKHIMNSVFAVVDVVFGRAPFRVHHFYIPLLYGVVYLTFTVVYWLAGGVSNRGETYLYKELQWEHPARAVKFAAKALIALCVMHGQAFLLDTCGCWTERWLHRRHLTTSHTSPSHIV